MSIPILATLLPLCAFYFYTLVSFQKELWRARHSKDHHPVAKTIPLYWHGGQLGGPDPSGKLPHETRQDMARPVVSPDGGKMPPMAANEPEQEIYQFDSAYVGSFLVVPIRAKKRTASHGRVTDITSRRAG